MGYGIHTNYFRLKEKFLSHDIQHLDWISNPFEERVEQSILSQKTVSKCVPCSDDGTKVPKQFF